MKKSVSFFWFFIIYLLVKKIVIYNHHGEAVLAFALGLLLALVNNFKPSEEEERELVISSLFRVIDTCSVTIYRFHAFDRTNT